MYKRQHLTCVSSTKDEVRGVIGQLKEQGIENILALRGDIPADGEFPLPNHYRYACELVAVSYTHLDVYKRQ